MALVKNVKVAIFSEREWQKGEYKGITYSGFMEDGGIITFSTKQTRFDCYDLSGYEDGKSITVRLVGRQWRDEPIRWQLADDQDEF